MASNSQPINELELNLINSQMSGFASRKSSHGGPGRNQGRKPAHDPAVAKRIPKSKTDGNLRVLTLGEEQVHWRKLLATVDQIATKADDYKTKLDAANTHLDALKAISELRRGRAYVAAPPQQQTNNELATLLRGLVPGEVKKQRRNKSETDPSTQKDEG